MDYLSLVGNICSILGMLVSAATFYAVLQFREAMKRRSRHDQLSKLIERILKVPSTKLTLPDANCADAAFVIETAMNYEFSSSSWKHRQGKRLVQEIRDELKGERRRDFIQHRIRLLRDEITE